MGQWEGEIESGHGQWDDGRERLESGQLDDGKGESFGSGQLDYGHLEEVSELMVELMEIG